MTEQTLKPRLGAAMGGVLGVSALAIAFLFWLIYFAPTPEHQQEWVAYLPYCNAFFNSCSAFFLVLGLRSILKGQRDLHMRFMWSAFGSSTLFLVSYIIYHSLHGDAKFLAEGLIRPIYFFILISHIGLSVVALPLILTTFFLAWKKQWAIHKKIARFTFPIWLYVSVTGVLIVAFLKIFNP